jgi:hypothetical protein
MVGITKPQYTLQIFAQDLSGISARPYLKDDYLNTITPLQLTDTNTIVFNVDAAIPSSAAPNRFKIVFNSFVLPVNFTGVKATTKDKDVVVDWNVAAQTQIEKYELERSAEGVHFTKVAEVSASGTGGALSYSWVDQHASTGDNYYRVRAVQINGERFLSKVVLATVKRAETTVTISPNPVMNRKVNIQLKDLPKGNYTFVIVNAQGQQVVKEDVFHEGGNLIQSFYLIKNLAGGIYYVHVIGKKDKYIRDFLVE